MGRPKGSTNKPKVVDQKQYNPANEEAKKVVDEISKAKEIVDKIKQDVVVKDEMTELQKIAEREMMQGMIQDTAQQDVVTEPIEDPEEEPTQVLSLTEQLELMFFTEDIVYFNSIEFTLKKYLPIGDKEDFITLVTDNCFQEKLGFTHIARELSFGYNLLTYYTDIDFRSLQPSEVYDLAKQSGLLDFVRRNIPQDEISFLENEITQAIKAKRPEYDNKKGFAEIVGEFLGKINDNIPQAIQDLKSFDPDKLGNVMDILDKFEKYNNPGANGGMNRQQRRAAEKKLDRVK